MQGGNLVCVDIFFSNLDAHFLRSNKGRLGYLREYSSSAELALVTAVCPYCLISYMTLEYSKP